MKFAACAVTFHTAGPFCMVVRQWCTQTSTCSLQHEFCMQIHAQLQKQQLQKVAWFILDSLISCQALQSTFSRCILVVSLQCFLLERGNLNQEQCKDFLMPLQLQPISVEVSPASFLTPLVAVQQEGTKGKPELA